MYEDVIKLVKTNMETCLEGEIMQAVMRVGVEVDKDELIRALAYDRGQYEKGYKDGQPKWISVKERLPEDVKDGDGYCVNYLVYIPEYRSVDIANYIEEADMWVCMGVPVNVTHWMPLPLPPEEEV